MKIINIARKICSLLFLILFFINSSLSVYSEIKIVTNYTLNIININEVNYPNIAITVSVIDQNGNPVLNLSEKDFELYEDNEKQTILSIKPIKSTITAKSIVMVLDCTGSMEGDPFEQLKNSTKKFISLLPEGWNVTLITIAGSVQEVISNNSNKEEMYQIIDSLEPDGRTPLYDAVYYGLQLAQNNKSINSIVLFSDGGDNESQQSYNSVSALLNVVKIPIYTIGFLSGGTNIHVLQTLSDESKGIYFSSPDLVDFQAIFSQISSVIQNQYEITYKSTKPGKKGEKKTIKIRYRNLLGTVYTKEEEYIQPVDLRIPVILIPGIMGSITITNNTNSSIGSDQEIIENLNQLLKPFHDWESDGKDLEVHTFFGGIHYHKLTTYLIKYAGYELNKNLFMFPYNWTKPCQVNGFHLKKYIDKIKSITGFQQVDVIAHSMGGLVARSYMEGFATLNDKQSNKNDIIAYDNDVRKLIMIGTPNQGSLSIYSFYNANKNHAPGLFNSDMQFNLLNVLIETFLIKGKLTKTIDKNIKNKQDYIRMIIPSVKQLLPTNYNYLYDRKTNKPMPMSSYVKNMFLENLNHNWSFKDNYYFLVGDNLSTPVSIYEDKNYIDIISLNIGDNRVVKKNSIPIPDIENNDHFFVFKDVQHSVLVSNPKVVNKIIQILMDKPGSVPEDNSIVKYSVYLLVQILSPANGYLISPSKKKIGFVHENAKVVNEIIQSTYWGPATKDNQDGIETFLIENPEEGEYELITKGFESGKVTIISNLISNEGAQERKTSFFTKSEKINSTKIRLKSDNNGKTALSYVGLPTTGIKIPKNNSLLLIIVMMLLFSVLLIPIILSSSTKSRQKSKTPFILYHDKKYLIHHSLTIGRSSSNDVIIDDPMISRQHAVIHYHFPQAEIQNLSKTNAIFVNGKKTTKSALYSYDSIMIGKHSLIYHE